MKKVLIVGEIYSGNLGDGVICEVVNNFFSKQFETRYFDLSGRDNFIKNNNLVDDFYIFNEQKNYLKSKIKKILFKLGYKKNGKNLNEIVKKANDKFDLLVRNYQPDIILFAGGQMFIDSFINQIEYICKYAEKNNIKVIFNACGIGNISSLIRLKLTFENQAVSYISVRDGFKICRSICSKTIVDTYDTAIIANKFYNIISTNRTKLGVGIMLSSLHPVKKQIKFWKNILNDLKGTNIEFKVFTNGSIKDQKFAKYLIKEVGLDSEVYLLEKPCTPNELINTINSFESILSMRLHSLIIAYSLNIPVISISWDEKVDTFFRKINREELCYKLFDDSSLITDDLEQKITKEYDDDIKKNIISTIENNLNNILKKINER